MSASASPKTATKTTPALNEAVLNRVATATQKRAAAQAAPKDFPNIQNNPFARIFADASLTPEAKRQAVAQALTMTGTKEECRARIRELEEFKEFMQASRSEMAKQIISLTDTEAFSELKRIYDEINSSLIDFDNRMAPLNDIIEAVYTLRTNGKVADAFREIQSDREAELDRAARRQAIQADLDAIRQGLDRENDEIARRRTERSFFGMGGIKPEAQAAIDAATARIEQNKVRLESLQGDLGKVEEEASASASRSGEFASEKAKLRELLDISSDDHKERQQALVQAALNFVNTAHDRIGAVRDHLGAMNAQVERLGDANGQMTQVYAVLSEGISDAAKNNQGIRETLKAPESEEDLIARMSREEKLTTLDSGIKALDSSKVDTMKGYADLSSQTIRINAMKESNEDQITRARAMQAQGVAGVADRLSVALQAVSAAAINEASSVTRDTLNLMTDRTNAIAQKEVIRVASGVSDTNAELVRAMDDLSSYGDVLSAGTQIQREGVAEMRGLLDQMQERANEIQESIRESVSVHAEAALSSPGKSEVKKDGDKGAGLKFPFTV